MTEQFQFLNYSAADGIIAVTLNRPPVNVLNIAMLRELEAALQTAAEMTDSRVLVLRAAGKLFSAGVDVADHTPDKVGKMIPLFDRVCTTLADFPSPTLAVVHSAALGGGCELILCCDMVLAAEDAFFGQPEIQLAMVAPIAALRLRELLGYRKAVEMMFTGQSIDGREAARIGLVNRAVPRDQLDAAAEEITARLSSLSAPALRFCKQSLRTGVATWATLDTVEELYCRDLMSTEDALEGLSSFLSKRKPIWKHK